MPVVAVINSNDDVVEMLRLSFEQAGFVVVSAHVDAIKRGETSLTDFVKVHKPQVIVFDLVPPYDSSYRFVEHLRETGILDGSRFVLTSTNPKRVQELAGEDRGGLRDRRKAVRPRSDHARRQGSITREADAVVSAFASVSGGWPANHSSLVKADERRLVARDRIELSTLRFSVGRNEFPWLPPPVLSPAFSNEFAKSGIWGKTGTPAF